MSLMRKIILLPLIAVLLAVPTFALAAGWEVKQIKDAVDDSVVNRVFVQSDDGHIVFLGKGPNVHNDSGGIWLRFVLDSGTLGTAQKFVVRIDKHKAREQSNEPTERSRRLGKLAIEIEKFARELERRLEKKGKYVKPRKKGSLKPTPLNNVFVWTPTAITGMVWHGEKNEKQGCGIMDEFKDGKTLLVRYFPTDLTKKDVYFDISTGVEKMWSALGIEKKCITDN